MKSEEHNTYFMEMKARHVRVTTMKRLDERSLHPLIQPPSKTCPGQVLNLGLHVGKGILYQRAS